jgi:sugar/nucleoside kinase (ribokinase family)
MCAKILRVCRALHAAGVRISFDPNVRKELVGDPAYFEAVRELMAICTIFLPSEDDAATLFPGEDLATFASRLFAGGVDHVVLKKGERGVEGMSANGERVSLAAHKVEVLDPTGAGDCFCATFVALIARGAYSFEGALQRANAAGALAVTKVGPMEGASHLATIEAFLEAQR